MRWIVPSLLLFASISHGIDSITVDDVTYEQIKLKKEYPSSLFIQHSKGTAFVGKAKLTKEQVEEIIADRGEANSSSPPQPPEALTYQGWIYRINDKDGTASFGGVRGEVTIIGHENPPDDVSFPSEIDGRLVTELDDPMFKENGANITSIKIPDSVKSVMCGTFTDLPSITNVSIGKGMMSVGTSLFTGCPALEKLEVSKENPNYSTEDGVLFNKDKTALISYPNGKEGKYIIPNDVKTIRNMAFTGGKLTELIIPEGVTEVEGGAFMGGFENLRSITIAKDTTKIGDNAFIGIYENVEKLSVPNTLQTEDELKRTGLNFHNISDLISTGALETQNNTVRYPKP